MNSLFCTRPNSSGETLKIDHACLRHIVHWTEWLNKWILNRSVINFVRHFIWGYNFARVVFLSYATSWLKIVKTAYYVQAPDAEYVDDSAYTWLFTENID